MSFLRRPLHFMTKSHGQMALCVGEGFQLPYHYWQYSSSFAAVVSRGVAHQRWSGSCVGQIGPRVPAHACGAGAAPWRPVQHGIWTGRALGALTFFECSMHLQVGAITLR